MKYFVVIPLLLALVTCGASNYNLPTKSVDLPAGITADEIITMYSDIRGSMWLGTKKGLYKWEGAKFILYESPNDSAFISALKNSPGDTLWVGFSDGTFGYIDGRDLVLFQPKGYDNKNLPVSDILIDKENRIWWATHGSGLFCFTNNKTYEITTSNGLNDNYVYDIEVSADNGIWVASDNGINICKFDTTADSVTCKKLPVELPDLIVLKLVSDHEGFMWMGFHQGGVGYYNNNDSTYHSVLHPDNKPFGKINALTLENNDVWIVDNNNGLAYSEHPHKKLLKTIVFDEEDINKGVKSVITDNLGNLWILNRNNLYVSYGPAISIVTDPKINEDFIFHSIAKSKDESIWVTSSNKLINIDYENVYYYLEGVIQPKSTFTSVVIDKNEIIWIGTLGQGLVKFNPSSHKYEIIDTQNGLINDNVLSLTLKNNLLWVSTLGGLESIKISNNSDILQFNSYESIGDLSKVFIYNVFIDSKERAWIGTDGKGLIKLENDSIYYYNNTDGITDETIYSITEDDFGNIWFSTSSATLYKYDGRTFSKYTSGQVFIGQSIFSLASYVNHILILTDEGINIYNQIDEKFVCLNEEIGVDVISSDINSVCQTEKYIAFATHKYIIVIDQELLSFHAIEPSTSLNLITVNLKPVDISEENTFSYSDNQFVFDYSGNWPLAPNKIQYWVMLEGYDQDWKLTYDHTAIYPNLSQGKYVFKVKAVTNTSDIIKPYEEFSFAIKSPFYFTIWFIAIVLLIIAALIYLYIKSRVLRLQKIEMQKKEKLEFEFQTLKNQVNPHFLFNSFSTLISIIDNDPKEAVEYTEALSDFFRNILEVKDQDLISVKEEISMLKNFMLIQKKRFGQNFIPTINLDEYVIENSLIPPLTLQLLTENAVKHNIIAKNKVLKIEIYNDQEYIYVKNNKRIKKNPVSSTGIGLNNIKDRYKIFSGQYITIEDTSELFCVKLPIIQS